MMDLSNNILSGMPTTAHSQKMRSAILAGNKYFTVAVVSGHFWRKDQPRFRKDFDGFLLYVFHFSLFSLVVYNAVHVVVNFVYNIALTIFNFDSVASNFMGIITPGGLACLTGFWSGDFAVVVPPIVAPVNFDGIFQSPPFVC